MMSKEKVTKKQLSQEFQRLLDNTQWFATKGAEDRWLRNRLSEMERLLSRFTNEQVRWAVDQYLDARDDDTVPLPTAGRIKGIILSDPNRWLPTADELPERSDWGPMPKHLEEHYQAHKEEIDAMDVENFWQDLQTRGQVQ